MSAREVRINKERDFIAKLDLTPHKNPVGETCRVKGEEPEINIFQGIADSISRTFSDRRSKLSAWGWLSRLKDEVPWRSSDAKMFLSCLIKWWIVVWNKPKMINGGTRREEPRRYRVGGSCSYAWWVCGQSQDTRWCRRKYATHHQFQWKRIMFVKQENELCFVVSLRQASANEVT